MPPRRILSPVAPRRRIANGACAASISGSEADLSGTALSQGDGTGEDWTESILHPAEPTQDNRRLKKGWHGLNHRLMEEMSNGEFVQKYRPNPVRLLFRVLDGHYDGELFCPVCEVVELVSLPPHPRSQEVLDKSVDPERHKLTYSNWDWAQPVRRSAVRSL